MSLSSLDTSIAKSVYMILILLVFSQFKIQSSQPTSQPTALVVSNRASNSITVSFTKAIDNPNGYLLIYKVGSSPTNGVPADGTSYSVGNALGGGIVGGKGNAPFTITGLTAGQQYFFDIYSYNGNNGGINYLQSIAPLEGSAWTLADSPIAQPTNLTFDLITSTGLRGSFKEASPIPSGGYFVLRKEGSDVSDVPVSGTFYSVGTVVGSSTVAFIGHSLSFTESNLAKATNYYYKIFSYAQGADPSTVSYLTSSKPLVGSQTTLSTSASIQASNIIYSGITSTQIKLTCNRGNGARRMVVAHANAPVDSYPSTAATYVANSVFGSGTSIGTGNFVVYDGTDSTVVVTGLTAGSTYYFQVFEYNGTGSTANYLTTTNSSNPSQQITIPSAPVIENASNEQSTSFIANWNKVRGASEYELDVALKSTGFSTFVNNYNALTLTDSTQIQQIVSGLTPNTLYQYRLRAKNAAGVSENSATKIVLTLGGSFQPPTIAVTASTASSISVQTNNGFNPSTNTITFYHRKITGDKFIAESDFKGSSVNVSIDPSWLDQLGVEYYFKVTDEANFKDSTKSQFLYTTLSNVNLLKQSNFVAGGTAQSYRIFSIPLQLSSNRIDDIFQAIEAQYGGVSKSKWRLVHYQDGQNVDYGAGLTSIEPGKSYWFNSLEAPPSINLSGTVTPANQTKEFVISLDKGFTQIGNPYPFDVSWTDVLTRNAHVAGIEGVGNLYTYDAAHTTFNKDVSTLKAWSGGFVHSNAPINLTIPVVASSAPGSRMGDEELTSSIDQPQWFVPLHITEGISNNNYSGFGMHPKAQIGYDLFDDFTPPRFASYLEVNSYHPEYQTPKFCSDIVTTAKSYNWNFEVESNSGEQKATMSWDNQSLVNNKAQLLLYDPSANVIVDMKKAASYDFEIHGKHSFKIFFGVDEESISPDITVLSYAYPNPFSTTTTIPFVTSLDQSNIQISIYDIMGHKIRDLAYAQYEPGYHEEIWDGTNAQGERATEGLYIYRLSGKNTSPQIGKVIMK